MGSHWAGLLVAGQVGRELLLAQAPTLRMATDDVGTLLQAPPTSQLTLVIRRGCWRVQCLSLQPEDNLSRLKNTQEDSEAADPPERRCRRHDIFYNQAHFLPTYRLIVSMSSALFHRIIRLQAPTAFGETQKISCAAIFQMDFK